MQQNPMDSKQDAPGVAAKHPPTSSRILCDSRHNVERSSSREAVSRHAQQVIKVRVAQSAELISATAGATVKLRLRNFASAPDPVVSSVEHSREALRSHAGPERIERLNYELALFKKAAKEAKEAASMPVKEAAMAEMATASKPTEPVTAATEAAVKDAIETSSDAAGPLTDATFNTAVAECMAQRLGAAAQRGVHDKYSMDHFQMPVPLCSVGRSSIPLSRQTIISDGHVPLQLPPANSRSREFTLLTLPPGQTMTASTSGMLPCKRGSLGSTSESAGQPCVTGPDRSVFSASQYESSTSSFLIDRSESSCEESCPILPGRFLASASNADAGASSDSGAFGATDAVSPVLANAAADSAANAEVAAANVHPDAIDESDTNSDDYEDDADFSSMDTAGVERLLSCPADDALAFWRQQVSLVDRLLGHAIANRLRVFADEAKALGNVEALLQELQTFANRSDSKA